MKVLFSQALPFFLAHGGTQTFAEAIMRELPALKVEAEPERWWDASQRGDILHFVGRPSSDLHLRLAKQKGFKTVMTEFLDQPSSRTKRELFFQRMIIRIARKTLPGLTGRLAWNSYRALDAMVYAAAHEWETAKYLFEATPSRGFVIPHGLTTRALEVLGEPAEPREFLVSVATIAPRKNTLLLAQSALLAQTPIVFLGKPYSEDNEYFREFSRLIDNKVVIYPGFVSEDEKFSYLKQARGFVLLSMFESGCVAAYEAAAAGLPLLLPDLPWATNGYPRDSRITHVSLGAAPAVATGLRAFYAQAHRSNNQTFEVQSWRAVAQKYVEIYESLMS